jgi:hypothetical protein
VAPVERATAAELTSALAAGAKGLEALAKKYPEDVAVMKSLIELYAKETATHLLGLEWAARVLDRQPELATWNTLKVLALQSAQADEPASSRALELMATLMGAIGGDLLYDLMVAGKHNVRERAERLLARDDVRARASSAVRIAYDLKTTSCDEQLELLERAAVDGDSRSVAVLSFNIDGAKRGCGPTRKSPCRPKCSEQIHQDRMRATIARIKAR